MPRPVVLLHPLGSDRTFWDGMPLPDGRRWAALDLPGHGTEAAPSVHGGVEGLAARVLDLADDAGLAQFDVAGVSLGGLVAQYLAVQHPDRVIGVVLIDTVATYPEAMEEMWVGRAATARSEGMSSLVGPTLDIWFTPEFRRSRPDVVEQTTRTLLSTDPEGYARTCEILASTDLTPRLADLPARTLSVCGDSDGEPFRNAAREIAAATGSTVRWLPGMHAAVLESPAEFVAHLVAFLDDDAASTPPERTSHE
ncbi:alpha/beta hydrolase [Nocardioides nanhaiensis]|uniref:Alpha/beta hydrolase n=2 Tax=Nocardioides nanhaiensis TaxID=1476871 RepID=A0ABP8W529_9ACTN